MTTSAGLIWLLAVASANGAGVDTTTFVVLGEGLAAGQSNFALHEAGQSSSFAVVCARQMGAAFPQPLLQAPGIGETPGQIGLPIRLPDYPQTTVRSKFPPYLFVFNLSVPGLRLSEALTVRPALPLVRTDHCKQTLVNMILGFPSLILNEEAPLWTQAEYAVALNPTLALVELGYAEAIDAAVSGDPARLPDAAVFEREYRTLLGRLRANYAEVIAATIPDPTRTAYFTAAATFADDLRRPRPEALAALRAASDDLLARDALNPAALHLLTGQALQLGATDVLPAARAARIRDAVAGLNAAIAAAARDHGVRVWDMAAFFREVAANGASAGSRRISCGYLGGFFSMDGFNPGATGHALLANDLLRFVNREFKTSFREADVAAVAATDPVARYRKAGETEAAK